MPQHTKKEQKKNKKKKAKKASKKPKNMFERLMDHAKKGK